AQIGRLFHVEHQIQLMVLSLVGPECALAHEGKVANPDRQPSFLAQLPRKGSRGRFAKLDVPTGKVPVSLPGVLAEQDLPIAIEQDTTGDEFDGLGHVLASWWEIASLSAHFTGKESGMSTQKSPTRKLGRGISSLLGDVVSVAVA